METPLSPETPAGGAFSTGGINELQRNLIRRGKRNQRMAGFYLVLVFVVLAAGLWGIVEVPDYIKSDRERLHSRTQSLVIGSNIKRIEEINRGLGEIDREFEEADRVLDELEKQRMLGGVALAADGLRGIVVGDRGIVLTTAGRARWTRRTSNTSSFLFGAALAADGRRGIAAGAGGAVLTTADGGASWTPRTSNTDIRLVGAALAADGRRGIVVGDRGAVLTTADGGASWTPRKSHVTSFLYGVSLAADGHRGIAVGDRGVVITTADGGASWIPRASRTRLRLFGVVLAADGHRGIAVGDRGAVLTTKDGGVRWTRRKSNTKSFLYGVALAADGLRGIAVGVGGAVLTTADGGASWTPRKSNTDLRLHGVALAADGRRGIAVGDRGVVLTTADGGASWIYISKTVEAKRKAALDEKGLFLDERERLVRENRELETGRVRRPSGKGKDAGMAEGSEAGRWDDLIKTASWRLPVLGLALFIIWILVRLNRYNKRLAGFYFARADVLLMLRAETDSVPLDIVERLMAMLSPDHLDFGRRPKAVARDAVDSARDRSADRGPQD